MNAEDLARLLLGDPEHTLERGAEALRIYPSNASDLLEHLLEGPDFDVQVWAIELIPETLGEAGAPLLLKACSHKDPDVRIDALFQAVEITRTPDLWKAARESCAGPA